MRVLISGLNYDPECIGIAVYTTGLAEFLNSQGHDTVVVTAHPYYPDWKHNPDWPRWRYVTKNSAEGLKVIHCPLFVPATPSFRNRLLHYISFLVSSFPITFWSCIKKKPDTIIAIAPSLVGAITALVCGKIFRAKTVIHVQDFEVDAAFATRALRAASPVARLALSFERWMLRRFGMVSTISDAMMRKAREKGVPTERLVEFRNWADLSGITPLEGVSPMRARLGLGDKNVVLYSGNISSKQGLDIIPATARHLRNRQDVVFVICGNGSYLQRLQASCANLENVRFIPLQPFQELGNLLGMADIHLLPQIAEVEELVLPSKLANMLASGRPVITTANADSALAREVEGCGRVVPPGDSEQLAEAIVEMLDHPADREEMGKAARKRALMRWDANEILGRYEKALKRMVNGVALAQMEQDDSV